MELYERVCGARMHAAFYRPNKMNLSGFSNKLLYDISFFINNARITINEINTLVIFNKIWKHRMVNVGVINQTMVSNFGLTGVISRSTGFYTDLRLNIGETYASYYYLKFNSFVGINGDTYDRYLIRINEINESLKIINDVLTYLTDSNLNDYNDFFSFFEKKWQKNPYKSMESLIQHFKY